MDALSRHRVDQPYDITIIIEFIYSTQLLVAITKLILGGNYEYGTGVSKAKWWWYGNEKKMRTHSACKMFWDYRRMFDDVATLAQG